MSHSIRLKHNKSKLVIIFSNLCKKCDGGYEIKTLGDKKHILILVLDVVPEDFWEDFF